MDVGVFYVLVGAVVVAAFARRLGWPAPLVVTTAALAVSLIPAVPAIEIDGELLLTLVLPPLLYSASLEVSFVGFARSMPHIRRLGIWLVALTAVAVGLAAWRIMPELTLPGALLLGAIVAPPDAVSAAAIGRQLGLPRRVMTVLSGESLINDATSLTLVRVFATAAAGASITVWQGIGEFVLAVVVGVAVGVLFGFVLHQFRMRIDDPTVTGTFGLLMPFGAYAIGEHLHGSGVLAVVAMGIYVGYNAPKTPYANRQQERPIWRSVDFLLESFVFAYIGLQFPRVVTELGSGEAGTIVLLAVVVFAVMLVVRPAFVYLSYWYGQRRQVGRLENLEGKLASERFQQRIELAKERAAERGQQWKADDDVFRERVIEPPLNKRDRAVISWAGMRGVVTLATAAAVPELTNGHLSSDVAEAMLVVAFLVTVGTLLLQGLTLPSLIRRLNVVDTDEREQDDAQLAAVSERTAEVGEAYLTGKREEWVERFGEPIGAMFDRMSSTFLRSKGGAEGARQIFDKIGLAEGGPRPTYEDMVDLNKGWLQARRDMLIEERDAGNLNEEVMREMMVAMDAEELALDTRGALRVGPSPE